MKRNTLIFLIIILLLANTHLVNAQGVSAPFKEYDIKAAFIYNFIKFVEWPENLMSSEKISIGILGIDPFGEKLDNMIEGKSIKDRKLTVDRYSDIKQIEFCHVLFISESESKALKSIFAYTKGKGILTIGESANFLKRGGIIKFLEKGNKVRFEINLKKAHETELKISSRLLRLADNLRAAVALFSPQFEFFPEAVKNSLLNQFEPL